MLDVARRSGAYKSLSTADMSKPLPNKDASYAAVICIGTFTQGHVGPEAISELVRVVEKGGFIVATVLDSIWESGGYEAAVTALAREGKVDVLSAEQEDYRRGAQVRARLVVLRVLS